MMQHYRDPKQGFRPEKIKLKVSNEALTSSAGLGTILEFFDESPLSKEFAKCLPERKSHNSHGSYRMALMMLASLIHGDDCLDDIEFEFSENPSAEKFFKGKIPVAKTFGDFLRDFEDSHIEQLSKFLTTLGYTARSHLREVLEGEHRPCEKPHFSVDSTVHEQHGSKIEGCAFNYANLWCLNSEMVTDELGLVYASKLQTGNTKPGSDGPKLLDQVLTPLRGEKLKAPSTRVADVSGDSAYGFEEFITTLQAHHVNFTIAARRNIPWETEIPKFVESDWMKWEYTPADLLKFSKKSKPLPERFLARWFWSPSWAPQLKFPIIVKKEWKTDPQFPDAGTWNYHAVITNENLLYVSYQQVYDKYLKRSNMENFIREVKVNLDAYHLPCLSFRANHAFSLLIMVAANLLRWVSLISQPNKPLFAKKLRRKFIFQAGKFTKHARQTSLFVTKKFKEEVDKLKEAWGRRPIIIPPSFSTA